ncbi:uncharacterized protein LOC126412390 [Schistocerca serialis cubense]|uniref:uncharacterized protein LOC126412390 n=1 Tax=Schistocerca serialis cubense TaxID=2023355 RepID=UPI00214E83C7|nr:uncharacterized protein LOC126412390 [Schistocerca serialis cubense]
MHKSYLVLISRKTSNIKSSHDTCHIEGVPSPVTPRPAEQVHVNSGLSLCDRSKLVDSSTYQFKLYITVVAIDASKPAGSSTNLPISAMSGPVATSPAILSRPAVTSRPAVVTTSSMSEPVVATWDLVVHIAHLLEQDKELLLSIPFIDFCDEDVRSAPNTSNAVTGSGPKQQQDGG